MKRNCVILSLVFIVVFTSLCFANSGERASLTVISKNEPKDLQLVFLIDGHMYQAEKKVKLDEAYFFYYESLLDFTGSGKVKRIFVHSEEKSFELDLSHKSLTYSEVFTLDFEQETLVNGKSPFRSLKLIAIRLSLTLLIEGSLFYIWGFRDKKSWLFFIVVNLLTQGYLNILINSQGPVGFEYMLRIILILEEVKILVVEWLLMLLLVKEGKRFKLVLYVFFANLISLIAGLILIPMLPV